MDAYRASTAGDGVRSPDPAPYTILVPTAEEWLVELYIATRWDDDKVYFTIRNRNGLTLAVGGPFGNTDAAVEVIGEVLKEATSEALDTINGK